MGISNVSVQCSGPIVPPDLQAFAQLVASDVRLIQSGQGYLVQNAIRTGTPEQRKAGLTAFKILGRPDHGGWLPQGMNMNDLGPEGIVPPDLQKKAMFQLVKNYFLGQLDAGNKAFVRRCAKDGKNPMVAKAAKAAIKEFINRPDHDGPLPIPTEFRQLEELRDYFKGYANDPSLRGF